MNGVCGSAATDVAASGHVEPEFCVQILSGDVVDTDLIELRITRGGTAFAAYDATPSVTVSESAPPALAIPIVMHHYKMMETA